MGRSKIFSNPNWREDVAAGRYPDAQIVPIWGKNATLSTLADIWPQNSVRTLWTAGVQLGFSSSSAADASGGTGARTLRATLVRASGAEVTEDIALNGQTKVQSVGTDYIRCQKMEVLTVGSGNVNAGSIYCYDTSDSLVSGVPQTATKIAGRIDVGENESLHGWWFVPAGKTAFLLTVRMSTGDATATAKYGRGQLKIQGPNLIAKLKPLGQMASPSAPDTMRPGPMILYPEKTDIIFQGTMSAAGEADLYAELLVMG
jgi:hypothetical protein